MEKLVDIVLFLHLEIINVFGNTGLPFDYVCFTWSVMLFWPT